MSAHLWLPHSHFPSPAIVLPLLGLFYSPARLLNRTRVLAPAPSVAESKRQTDLLLSGCITRIPENCFSNASSLTEQPCLVFPEPLAAEREGVSAQEQGGTRLSPPGPPLFPATAALQRCLVQSPVPSPAPRCSLLHRRLHLFTCPGVCSTPAPTSVPQLEGAGRGRLCTGLSVSAGDQAAWLRTTLCCTGFLLNSSTPFLVSSLST